MNDLEREIEFLLIDQKQDWKLARENYGSLTNVQTRYFQDDYRTTILNLTRNGFVLPLLRSTRHPCWRAPVFSAIGRKNKRE